MEIRRLLIITFMILLTLFAFQYFVFHYTKNLYLSFGDKASTFMLVQNVCHLNNSGLCRFHPIDSGVNNLDTKENFDYDTNKRVREEVVDLRSEFLKEGKIVDKSLMLENSNQTEDTVLRETNVELSYSPLMKGDVLEDSNMTADEAKAISSPGESEIRNQIMVVPNQSQGTMNNSIEKVDQTYSELMKKGSVGLNDRMVGPDISTLSGPFISISQIYSKLSRAHRSTCLKVWITFPGSTFE